MHMQTIFRKKVLACQRHFKSPVKRNAIHNTIDCDQLLCLKIQGSVFVRLKRSEPSFRLKTSPKLAWCQYLALEVPASSGFWKFSLFKHASTLHFANFSNNYSHILENMFPDLPLMEYSEIQVQISTDYRIHSVESGFCMEIVKFK